MSPKVTLRTWKYWLAPDASDYWIELEDREKPWWVDTDTAIPGVVIASSITGVRQTVYTELARASEHLEKAALEGQNAPTALPAPAPPADAMYDLSGLEWREYTGMVYGYLTRERFVSLPGHGPLGRVYQRSRETGGGWTFIPATGAEPHRAWGTAEHAMAHLVRHEHDYRDRAATTALTELQAFTAAQRQAAVIPPGEEAE